MHIMNLLRHAMAKTMSEGIVNCLIVTDSPEANIQLTRIHEHIFSRTSYNILEYLRSCANLRRCYGCFCLAETDVHRRRGAMLTSHVAFLSLRTHAGTHGHALPRRQR